MSQCDDGSLGVILRACALFAAIVLTISIVVSIGFGLAIRIVSWILEF